MAERVSLDDLIGYVLKITTEFKEEHKVNIEIDESDDLNQL